MTVRLKTLRLEDVEQIVAWQKDVKLEEYFRAFPANFVWTDPRAIDVHLGGMYAIWAEDTYCGLAHLRRIDAVNRNCEFGMMVDKGLVKSRREVSHAVFHQAADYMFKYMGFNKMYMTFLTHRKDIITYAQSEGFVFEARLRESCFWKGSYQDEFVMGLLAKDYKESH